MERKNRIVFLKGRKVILRPLDKTTDLGSCLRWMNNPEIRQYIRRFLPITKQTEEEWFDELGKRPNQISLAINTLGGLFIGIISLGDIELKDRTAGTGTIIGEKKYWGRGYGTDAKMILLDYAFNQLGLRKICSSVFGFNERSLRYDRRCGYKIEGILKKQVLKNGEYVDNVLLAVFKEDWLPIWKKYQKTGKVK